MKNVSMCALAALLVAACQDQPEQAVPAAPAPTLQEPEQPPPGPDKPRAQVGEPRPDEARGEPADEAIAARTAELRLAGVGTCTPDAELGAAAARFMSIADADGDGRVSKEEAHAATSFLVGGLFFRADEDSDGVVTPEEGRAVRAELAASHPMAAMLLSRARKTTGDAPLVRVAELLDVEYGQPIRAAEARTAARGAVDELFGAVDGDRDGHLTGPEVRTASTRVVAAAGDAAFRAVDADEDGAIAMTELEGWLQRASRAAFDLADRDRDGRLTRPEAAAAVQGLAQRVAGAEDVDSGT